MRPDETPTAQFQRPSQRPASVTRAITLLYISILLGLCVTIGTTIWSLHHGATHVAGPLTVEIIIWLVFLFFTYQIGKGANWARLVMLILVVITVVMKLVSIGFVFSVSMLIGILVVVIMVLQIWAMCHLFGKSAKPWFE